MDGITQLRLARGHLDGADGDARCRLRSAAREFWWATAEAADWPGELRTEAERLLPVLFDRGAINVAVSGMDDATVLRVSAEIRAFCIATERRQADRPPPRVRRCDLDE